MKLAPAMLLIAACGSDSKMMPMVDTPTVPAMITVSGVASERSLMGTTMVKDLTVAAYSATDTSTPVVTTTTDTNGKYTLVIPTMGKPVDGFIKATKTNYLDTYLYAPAPMTADFANASLNELTQNEYDLLSGTLCGVTEASGMGTVAVEVIDTAQATIGGAMTATAPAASKECYDQGGFPNKSATVTDTDGVAIMFNVAPGSVTVSATKSGATFKTHTVNVVAGAFTTTLVSE
jgi:hypothetical protein